MFEAGSVSEGHLLHAPSMVQVRLASAREKRAGYGMLFLGKPAKLRHGMLLGKGVLNRAT